VVAVDADGGNVGCIRENLALYKASSGRSVDLLQAAVWNEDGKLEFSSEGNMGSSAVDIVGAGRGATVKVPALTLDSVADHYGVERVDFIKCDIEGAEAVIFDRPRFFERFRPRIVVEVHPVSGELTTRRVLEALKPFGYDCRETPQIGSRLPLLVCLPT
jgi:FkbM family methyltransferase